VYKNDLRTLFTVRLKETHAEFLDICIPRIDTFGVGLSLLNVLNTFERIFTGGYISMYNDFNKLFYSMITPDYTKRPSIDTILTTYRTILSTYGLKHPEQQKIRFSLETNTKQPSNRRNTLSKPSKSNKKQTLKQKYPNTWT
jgi:hypothetical protein